MPPADPGAPAPDTPRTTPAADGGGDEWDVQQIRIGLVLNGGVSLAVWMSGVVLELHHCALASQHRGSWPTYRKVLELLRASARIDVIAGTSAGGLNGAFLALGQVHHRDLTVLRDLWRDAGSLEKLFRPPLEKNPPSLMRGDGYFLVELRRALNELLAERFSVPAGSGDSARETPPVELVLTGTLWDGRTSTFTDDLGTRITERDYDATFHFADAELADITTPARPGRPEPAIVDRLAHAARCTASFPAAFEPHYVEMLADTPAEPGRWATTAGQANFDRCQHVIDGGVLLNKPVRPALEAIYQQPGREEVRRVLAYVVPDPGGSGPDTTAGAAAAAAPRTPVAGEVLLTMLTRMRSTDSVARELAEIQKHNAAAQERRRARARLAGVLPALGPDVTDRLWDGYGAERIDQGAATIARLVAAGQRRLDDRTVDDHWSERELAAALSRHIVEQRVCWIPGLANPRPGDAIAGAAADWQWGQSTIVRLADLTVDVLRRALSLTPVTADNKAIREVIVAERARLAPVLEQINAEQANLQRFWVDAPARPAADAPGPIPTRRPAQRGPSAAGTGTDANTAALDAWLAGILQAWDALPVPGVDGLTHRNVQYRQAHALASALAAAAPSLRAAAAPTALPGDPWEVDALRGLVGWLLPPGTSSPEDVLDRMLRLEVVLVATGGALATNEQVVELVQVSSLEPGLLTGIQLNHFGAFYRPSWRVNDWIRGRRDGARQVLRFLLSPARLRHLGRGLDELVDGVRAIVVDAAPADREWLGQEWGRRADRVRAELAAALAGTDTPLEATAEALALPVELGILREDLDALADAVAAEAPPTRAGRAWLTGYPPKHAAGGQPASAGTLPAARVWELGEAMRGIGGDQIGEDAGSDVFARTVAHAAAVAASAFAATPKIGAAKPVATTMKVVRGYLLAVWAMVAYLTSGSRIGPRIVAGAVAVGGVLLAITLFVPAVPVGIVVAGALLVLAGASAAGLRTEGAHGLGRRLAGAAFLALVAVGGIVWWQVHEHGASSLIGIGVKIGVGLVIVGIGWFLAAAGRPGRGKDVREQ